MQLSSQPWTKVRPKLFRFLCLGVITVLLAGMLFAAQPNGNAQAAPEVTCTNVTSVPDLDWNSAATWSCGHIPTASDDVIITNGSQVNLSTNQSVHNLTIGATGSFGTLMFTSPVRLDIGGNLTVTADGLLDPGSDATGGTIQLVGTATQTIATAGQNVDFWNLTKISYAAGQALSFSTGASGFYINVRNNLTLRGSPANYLVLNSAIPGTQWAIVADESRDLNWLQVQDSKNLSASPISVVDWISTGNNTAWATDLDTTSSIAVAAPQNPALNGNDVTLTFKVYPATATGDVTFFEGDDEVGTCQHMLLIDGAVGCTILGMSYGPHTFHAVFNSADDNFTEATSNTIIQVMAHGFFLPSVSR